MFLYLLSNLLFFCFVFACVDHDYHLHPKKALHKGSQEPGSGTKNWTYTESSDWGSKWIQCQSGAHQSPIALNLFHGLSQRHEPTFNYSGQVAGRLRNWGYGMIVSVKLPLDSF